jgi:hypothetical protein
VLPEGKVNVVWYTTPPAPPPPLPPPPLYTVPPPPATAKISTAPCWNAEKVAEAVNTWYVLDPENIISPPDADI